MELDAKQETLARWVQKTFGNALSVDREERIARLVEEVVELAQAEDFPPGRVNELVTHVYAKPKGDPFAEAGGVFVTLLAYLSAAGFCASMVLETELARIYAIPQTVWDARHAAKVAKGIAAAMQNERHTRAVALAREVGISVYDARYAIDRADGDVARARVIVFKAHELGLDVADYVRRGAL